MNHDGVEGGEDKYIILIVSNVSSTGIATALVLPLSDVTPLAIDNWLVRNISSSLNHGDRFEYIDFSKVIEHQNTTQFPTEIVCGGNKLTVRVMSPVKLDFDNGVVIDDLEFKPSTIREMADSIESRSGYVIVATDGRMIATSRLEYASFGHRIQVSRQLMSEDNDVYEYTSSYGSFTLKHLK